MEFFINFECQLRRLIKIIIPAQMFPDHLMSKKMELNVIKNTSIIQLVMSKSRFILFSELWAITIYSYKRFGRIRRDSEWEDRINSPDLTVYSACVIS